MLILDDIINRIEYFNDTFLLSDVLDAFLIRLIENPDSIEPFLNEIREKDYFVCNRGSVAYTEGTTSFVENFYTPDEKNLLDTEKSLYEFLFDFIESDKRTMEDLISKINDDENFIVCRVEKLMDFESYRPLKLHTQFYFSVSE